MNTKPFIIFRDKVVYDKKIPATKNGDVDIFVAQADLVQHRHHDPSIRSYRSGQDRRKHCLLCTYHRSTLWYLVQLLLLAAVVSYENNLSYV